LAATLKKQQEFWNVPEILMKQGETRKNEKGK
jgi:hypothetical protein